MKLDLNDLKVAKEYLESRNNNEIMSKLFRHSKNKYNTKHNDNRLKSIENVIEILEKNPYSEMTEVTLQDVLDRAKYNYKKHLILRKIYI